MKIMLLQNDILADYYPRGRNSCQFFPKKTWEELCHIAPRSEMTKKIISKKYSVSEEYAAEMQDILLLNVMCGSHLANKNYCKEIKLVPYALIKTSITALDEHKKLLTIPIVKDFFNLLCKLEKSYDWQYATKKIRLFSSSFRS